LSKCTKHPLREFCRCDGGGAPRRLHRLRSNRPHFLFGLAKRKPPRPVKRKTLYLRMVSAPTSLSRLLSAKTKRATPKNKHPEACPLGGVPRGGRSPRLSRFKGCRRKSKSPLLCFFDGYRRFFAHRKEMGVHWAAGSETPAYAHHHRSGGISPPSGDGKTRKSHFFYKNPPLTGGN